MAAETRKCPFCNNEIDINAAVCPSCGTRLDQDATLAAGVKPLKGPVSNLPTQDQGGETSTPPGEESATIASTSPTQSANVIIPPTPPGQPPAKQKNTTWIWVAVVGGVLVLCCCGLAIGLYFGGDRLASMVRLNQAAVTSPPTPITTEQPNATLEPMLESSPTLAAAEEIQPTPTTPETTLEPSPTLAATEEIQPTPTTPALPAADLTLWMTSKSDTLSNLVNQYHKDNPSITVKIEVISDTQIIDRWKKGVGDGTAADLMLADNTYLWKLVEAKLVQPLDDYGISNQKGYIKTALSGMTIGGKLYGAPVHFELAGLFYNSSIVKDPPTKISDLSLLYRSGNKLGMVKSPYYSMGFFTAYGATLFDETGRCVATKTGLEDATDLLHQIRKYGSFLEDDPAIIRDKFKKAQLAMVIDKSSMLPEYRQALGDNLGSMPIPGATNPASAILQQTGFYLNPKSNNPKIAVNLALYLSSAEAQTAYLADDWIPTRSDVQVKDKVIKGFVDGAKTGYVLPQEAWFSNWEQPFQDMINQVLNSVLDLPDAINLACSKMNTLNNK
jgi:arabinogalactan oligomer/maltooligosaccharide transport system substrate-binding protein